MAATLPPRSLATPASARVFGRGVRANLCVSQRVPDRLAVAPDPRRVARDVDRAKAPGRREHVVVRPGHVVPQALHEAPEAAGAQELVAGAEARRRHRDVDVAAAGIVQRVAEQDVLDPGTRQRARERQRERRLGRAGAGDGERAHTGRLRCARSNAARRRNSGFVRR